MMEMCGMHIFLFFFSVDVGSRRFGWGVGVAVAVDRGWRGELGAIWMD